MTNQITNLAGTTYFVGQKVKSTDHWTGTVYKIKGDRLYVNPDNINDVPEYMCWKLNPIAAERAGKPDFCIPRDNGQSMGNFIPVEA